MQSPAVFRRPTTGRGHTGEAAPVPWKAEGAAPNRLSGVAGSPEQSLQGVPGRFDSDYLHILSRDRRLL